MLRGGHALAPAQIDYLQYAREVAEILERGEEPHLETLPPTTLIAKDPAEWQCDLRQGVAVDIETLGGKIRGVGFCSIADERPLWLPLLRADGANWWSDDLYIRQWINMILAESTLLKVFHNGVGFDVPFLIREGFTVRGPIRDTMQEAHTHQPEMPIGLQWLSITHLRMGVWKDMVEEEEELGVK